MTTKNNTSKDDFNATSHKTDVSGSAFDLKRYRHYIPFAI